jgi:protein-S-isoprenylcysteine O-methyltransferase Ste14
MAGAGVGAVVSVVAPRNRTRGGGALAGGGATLAATLLGLVALLALSLLLVAFVATTGLPETLIRVVALTLTAALCAALVAWAARRAQQDPLRMQHALVSA